ncbi:helix-turn-helix domain-containing protein [Actinomadura sp. 3N508]|uniref:helix-turn-helix domain-containing protein n=1 Tax=Actinomadura sp. 3N508 TaxID=3375153 RepID=UPI0037A7983D
MLRGRQALGNELGRVRLAAGLSAVALAQTTGAVCGRAWHRTKVSKLEHGVTAPTPEDIRIWWRFAVCPSELRG